MNKFLLLVALTGGGAVGGFVRGPFVPLAVYYLYAVLRPQFLWRWQLLAYPDVGWSFWVAVSAIAAYVPWAVGAVGPKHDPDRRVLPAFGWVHRLMAAFAAWVGLSYAFANSRAAAEPYAVEYLKIFAMYLLATRTVRSLGQVRALVLLVTLALGYVAVDVNHEYLSTGYLVLVQQGYAGLDNNGAGLLLAMGIPLCYFAWEATRGWYRWGFLLLIPVILHAVVSSYSRGAMVSCLAVAPLYLVYTRRRRVLLVVYAAVAVMLPVLAGPQIRDRFLTAQQADADASFNSRLDSWAAAVKIANEYPVFGAGVRNSNLISRAYGADREGRTIHSTYLQIAADSGWVGMALYVGTLAAAVVALWRARLRLWKRADDESARTAALLGGVECSLLTFAVGGSALSLETFELPYLLTLLGGQAWGILNARVLPPPGAGRAPPPNQVVVTPRRPLPVSGGVP
jgi:probable O-glycosylation ligase (exosortase A-associated)